jgi:hypothetical protein
MSDSIIIPSEFNINNLSYGDVKKLDNGGKVIYMSYNKRPLVIQTVECYAPFGLQCFNNDEGKSDSYSIDMSFKDMDLPKRGNLKKLYDVFDTIDKQNISKGLENATNWLGKKNLKSVDVVEALYTPIIKTSKEPEKYPSTFKIKLPYRNNMFQCDVFNQSNEQIDLKTIEPAETKGSKIIALIQCTGIWMAGGKFGCSWKCVQMKIVLQQKLKGFCLRNIPDDSINEDEDVSEPDDQKSKIKEVDEDEDDDDDDDDDDVSDDDTDDEEPKSSKKNTNRTKNK